MLGRSARFLSNIPSRMMSLSAQRFPKIAVCQITSSSDKTRNFEECAKLITEASNQNAQMVFFPENTDFIAEKKEQAWVNAEPMDGPLLDMYKQIAKAHKLWISLGSFHVRHPELEQRKVSNTHIIIDSDGKIAATYDKIHLFDVDIPTFRVKESNIAFGGSHLTDPVETPVGNVGLGICYDLRFPELALNLAKRGAQILTYPSAFTVATGYAHWEALLRARAIETQCYVVAAAQVGEHNPKRSSYGHSVVIDPWGAIISQASDTSNQIIYAEINLGYLEDIRKRMPIWDHRRGDIYGETQATFGPVDIDSQETYKFGQVTLSKEQLFYRTRRTMAFVNLRPVLRGHVLVTPIRVAERLKDLTADERSDIMKVVKRVQSAIEAEFDADASSVNIQDGVLAGRSIDHLHFHILPRHEGDFKHDNDVYEELQDPTPRAPNRTFEEMKEEAMRLRRYFV